MMRYLVIMLLFTSAASLAQQPKVTLRATVTGNQEQPRVMYILPWQPPEGREYEYTPTQALADDLFRRLDRKEFVREMEYRDALGSADSSINHSRQD
jgi:hypothetical protein